MSEKYLSRNTHKISDDVWWYEENKGIEVHINTELRHETFVIPWRSIRPALERKDK